MRTYVLKKTPSQFYKSTVTCFKELHSASNLGDTLSNPERAPEFEKNNNTLQRYLKK